MTIRIRNRDARQYVESRTPFEGSHLYAVFTERGDYAVFSYGTHHPLVVAVPYDERTLWFANKYKRSQTTTRHLNYCLPQEADIVWLNPDQMQTLIKEGYDTLVRQQLS